MYVFIEFKKNLTAFCATKFIRRSICMIGKLYAIGSTIISSTNQNKVA